jgi:hypothetical protein
MRAALLMLSVMCSGTLVACTAQERSSAEPMSMRERLTTETHLYVATSGSAGAITAQRRTDTGWAEQLVDLKLDGGELVTGAARGGMITLTGLEIGFQTIAIPATVIGHEAQLTKPHLHLAAPTAVTAAWSGDDSAEAGAELDLELTWSLTVDGASLPIGAPDLPPLPVKLQLIGDGARITAEIRVHAAGEVWNWADLVKLSDLELVLGAATPAQ